MVQFSGVYVSGRALSLQEACEKLEGWRISYTEERPHNMIGSTPLIMLANSAGETSPPGLSGAVSSRPEWSDVGSSATPHLTKLGKRVAKGLYVRVPSLKGEVGYINVLDGETTAVQRQLRRGGMGGYEPAFQATLLAACSQFKKPIFYDVGAHIGIYSALVAKIFDNSIGVAFEPTPKTHAIARDLRNINELNYIITKRGVSDKEGTVKLFLSTKTESSNSLNPDFRPGGGHVDIRIISLDRFIAGGFPIPNVVKVDVETHEPEVFAGAIGALTAKKPWILCELLPKVDRQALNAQLQILAHIGYSFYRIDEDLRFSPSAIPDVLDSGLGAASRDWLFSPTTLSEEFCVITDAWRHAIAACGAEENLINKEYTSGT